MRGRFWIAGGALLAGAGVAAGAIGAHYLKEKPEFDLQAYEVAVRYQMFHALALILVGILSGRVRSAWLTAAGTAFLVGMVLFSGGLYAWLFTGVKPFVYVVPVGGVTWIIGWLLAALGALGFQSETE
jgi:uncharacterized membrane protein YgdD (TMEM256/DUF423 family)